MQILEKLSGGWRTALIAAAVAALAGLLGVFTLPVLDRDEARYAQATAQMLQTGDFVRITFLDEDRNKKPVGIHWLQSAAVAATTGEAARAIWAYRLPSVLGAMLAALAAALIAGRLLGGRAGLYAGALLGASVLMGAEAGIAKTDAMLAGATGLALYGLLRLRLASPNDRRTRRTWALAVWALLGLGVLIKGPVAPFVLGVSAGALVMLDAWASRAEGGAAAALMRSMAWLKPLAFWPGPVLAALIVVPWLISVQIATDGAFLREALGDDLGPKLVSGDEGHGGLPGYHILLLPVTLFPAALFLPAGLAAARRALRTGGDAALAARVLIAFSLPVWLMFELLPTKLPHYVLPAFPAIMALCAWGAMEWDRTRVVWKGVGLALSLMGLAVWSAAFAWLTFVHHGPVLILALVLAMIAVLAAVQSLAAFRRRAAGAVLAAVALGLVWHGAGRGLIAPGTDLSPSQSAARITAELDLRPANAPLISTYTEPSLVFSLGGAVQLADIDDLAEAWLAPSGDAGFALSPQFQTQGPALVIIDHSRAPQEGEGAARAQALIALLQTEACRSGEVQGYNYSRGRQVRLTLHRTGPCG